MRASDIVYRSAARRAVNPAAGVSSPRMTHFDQNHFMEGGRWFTRVGMVIRDSATLKEKQDGKTRS